jgi:hypothetical protein
MVLAFDTQQMLSYPVSFIHSAVRRAGSDPRVECSGCTAPTEELRRVSDQRRNPVKLHAWKNATRVPTASYVTGKTKKQ